MQAYSYDVTIKEDGRLDLNIKIPEIKGEKVRIIVVGPCTDEIGLTTEEIMKVVGEDWIEWYYSPEEDIYDEYRKYLSER
jgi:hypothetical protein